MGPIVAVETRVQSPRDVDAWAGTFRDDLENLDIFLEFAPEADPDPLIARIAEARKHRSQTHAKVRTGGVTEAAIPSPERIARFLVTCRDYGVACKATAGLHHALPGEYPLTYEPDSPCGTLHGLFPLLLGAALACTDYPGEGMAGWEDVSAMMMERDRRAFRVVTGPEGGPVIRWRDRAISEGALRAGRRQLLLSIGSCSFEEPVDELAQLGVNLHTHNGRGPWIRTP